MKATKNSDFNFKSLKSQVERIQDLLYKSIKELARLRRSQEIFDKGLEEVVYSENSQNQSWIKHMI